MMTSGPSPVGTCATKSVRMSPDTFWTRSTLTPVSVWNSSTIGFIASIRVSSTHIVRVPLAAAVVGGALVVGEPPLDPLEHAASARVSPATATKGMLRRIVYSSFGNVPSADGRPPTMA